MKLRTLVTFGIALMVAAPSVLAIAPGSDLLITGAGRTNRWHSDLYINNANATTVSVRVYWLVQDQANPNPDSRSYTIGPDETLILEDVLRNDFGFNSAGGAFRITSTGGEVTANLIVFTGFNDPVGGTFGSGFEAVPASAAVGAGESSTLMGLESSSTYYTNLFALAGPNGATLDIDLLDEDGDVVDTAQVTLEAYEPTLWFRTNLWSTGSYDSGTALVRVSSGSALVFGSKVDENSGDPTTLEFAFGAGAGSSDGIYQFAVYDSLGFASGGNLVISDDMVDAINGTYINFDKVDGGGESECTLIFLFGVGLSPTDVQDFESGVEFTDTYPDGGEMAWTLTFTVDDNMSLSGTVAAVGSSFSGTDTGCNGTFPTLTFEGGKSN